MKPSDIIALGRTEFMDSKWQDMEIESGIWAVTKWVSENHNEWRPLSLEEKQTCYQSLFGRPFEPEKSGPVRPSTYGFAAVNSFEGFKSNFPKMKI